MTANLAAWADVYQSIGWRVLAVRSGEKPPAEGGWCHDGVQSAEWLAAWESKGYNLGIQAGNSGLVVVDVDGETGAESVRTAKGKGIIDLPETLMQKTPKGWHLLYEVPFDSVLKPGVDVLGGIGLHGIDIRAANSYIVACPSVTPSGGYRWMNWGTKPVAASASVLALARGGRFRDGRFDPKAGREAAVKVAVRVARETLRHGEGQHDSFYTLVSTVASGLAMADPGADPAELMEAVVSYAEWANSRFAEPYEDDEINRVVGDIVRKNQAAADIAVAFVESRSAT